MSLFPKFKINTGPAAIPAIPAIPETLHSAPELPNSGNSGNSNTVTHELMPTITNGPAGPVQVPQSDPALAPAIPLDPDDDRRLCTACLRLDLDGRCLAAVRGEIVASRTYRPVLTRLRRCEGYQPGPDDPDRRSGTERWPGLVPALGEQEATYA